MADDMVHGDKERWDPFNDSKPPDGDGRKPSAVQKSNDEAIQASSDGGRRSNPLIFAVNNK